MCNGSSSHHTIVLWPLTRITSDVYGWGWDVLHQLGRLACNMSRDIHCLHFWPWIFGFVTHLCSRSKKHFSVPGKHIMRVSENIYDAKTRKTKKIDPNIERGLSVTEGHHTIPLDEPHHRVLLRRDVPHHQRRHLHHQPRHHLLDVHALNMHHRNHGQPGPLSGEGHAIPVSVDAGAYSVA